MGQTELIFLHFREDFWGNHFTKDIYSFTDFVSDVGGIFNSIYGGGKILVLIFADSIIVTKLLGELYSYKEKRKNGLRLNGNDNSENQDVAQINQIKEELSQRKPFLMSKWEFICNSLSCMRCG
mmetsp:Transcript_13988/g.13593  ORF Transcript_13988/g.13593 Transcript_13988/m.13593 type:complete len:124 (+) Transcript_13988:640-1011(+)